APPDEKMRCLAIWRSEIGQLFAARPAHPVSQALVQPVARYGLQQQDFLAVIDGMQMDAAARIRIADLDELFLYCDRVASAVGRLCVRAFGLGQTEGIDLARSLGLALQLTNILRDVAEDAGLDRVYLPADLLTEAGVVSKEALAIAQDPGTAKVCQALAERAATHFEESRALMAAADAAAVRPAVMMAAVYSDVLTRLRARGWRDLDRGVGPSKFGKLWIALKHGWAP
ncbi:MAG: squalene/phytoene synthase family protein, partial [Proteobacteria bacterium]|nr:squalene/phytoene synthase family protein [Pseudomonadota bacterium]